MGTTVKEITYEKLDDFLNDTTNINGWLFKEFIKCSESSVICHYVFRGESSINNRLIPNSLRSENERRLCMLSGLYSPTRGIKTELEQIQCEDRILKSFFSRCDYNGLKVPIIDRLRYHNLSSSYFLDNRHWLPDDYFELAGLAQHYGLPTRLLDWSSNFFVALYFAIKKTKKKDCYCSIWALNYSSINRYFEDYQNKIRVIIPEYSQNPNLQAQKGIFTHWQIALYKDLIEKNPVDRRPLDELFEINLPPSELTNFSNLFYKINIPVRFVNDLYFYLSAIGFDGSNLFPGYSGITTSLEEDAKFLQKYKNACP